MAAGTGAQPPGRAHAAPNGRPSSDRSPTASATLCAYTVSSAVLRSDLHYRVLSLAWRGSGPRGACSRGLPLEERIARPTGAPPVTLKLRATLRRRLPCRLRHRQGGMCRELTSDVLSLTLRSMFDVTSSVLPMSEPRKGCCSVHCPTARYSARHAAPLPHRGAPDPEASSAGSIARWAQIPPRRPPSAAPEPPLLRQHQILPLP
eukprot:COSAG03_NODE_713_length_6149_cov_3.209256_7_plen_205_part_00